MTRKSREPEEAKIDMTPMIDIIFQLVIFFLIVTDLSQKEIEQLELPDSDVAVEDKAQEDQKRIIINLVMDKEHKGATPKFIAKLKGKRYSHTDLRTRLQSIASVSPRDDDGLSKLYVLIRADRDTPWRQVQLIMQDCAQPDIQIWKLQFATRDDTPYTPPGDK